MANGNFVRDMLLSQGAQPTLVDAFLEYHRKCPDVWARFEARALEEAQRTQRLSAKAIGEDLRRDSIVRGEGEFKVCNTFLSYYARVFAAKHPQCNAKFEFKSLGAKGDL